VRNLKNDKAQNEAEARKKIQTLANRLDSGEDFGTLAMNYSEDSETSANAGDLGFTPESALRNTDPLTRELVTKLKPGQYSPIITIVNPMTKQLAASALLKFFPKSPRDSASWPIPASRLQFARSFRSAASNSLRRHTTRCFGTRRE